MAWALVQSNEGISALATTTVTFLSAPTPGNLVVLGIAADDYNGSPNAGWTQSPEMEQQTFLGGYLWWMESDGSTSPGDYTIGSATGSSWFLQEFSCNPGFTVDTSQGNFSNANGPTLASDVITPSTGERLLVSVFGGSITASQVATTLTWNASFTKIGEIGNNIGGTRDVVGMAYRIVTGDGVTTFTTTCTFSINQSARASMMIAFIDGEEPPPPEEPPGILMGQACM